MSPCHKLLTSSSHVLLASHGSALSQFSWVGASAASAASVADRFHCELSDHVRPVRSGQHVMSCFFFVLVWPVCHILVCRPELLATQFDLETLGPLRSMGDCRIKHGCPGQIFSCKLHSLRSLHSLFFKALKSLV